MSSPFTAPTVAAWFEGCHELTKEWAESCRKNITPAEMSLRIHETRIWFDLRGYRASEFEIEAYNAICTDALRLRRIIDHGMKARARNLVKLIRVKLFACDMPNTCFSEHNRAVSWERRMHHWADRIAAKYLGGKSW